MASWFGCISMWWVLLLLNRKAGENVTTTTPSSPNPALGGRRQQRMYRNISYLVSKWNLQWKLLFFTENLFGFHRGVIKPTGNPRVSAHRATLTLAASRKTLSLICRTLLRITARATPAIQLMPIRATAFPNTQPRCHESPRVLFLSLATKGQTLWSLKSVILISIFSLLPQNK